MLKKMKISVILMMSKGLKEESSSYVKVIKVKGKLLLTSKMNRLVRTGNNKVLLVSVSKCKIEIVFNLSKEMNVI